MDGCEQITGGVEKTHSLTLFSTAAAAEAQICRILLLGLRRCWRMKPVCRTCNCLRGKFVLNHSYLHFPDMEMDGVSHQHVCLSIEECFSSRQKLLCSSQEAWFSPRYSDVITGLQIGQQLFFTVEICTNISVVLRKQRNISQIQILLCHWLVVFVSPCLFLFEHLLAGLSRTSRSSTSDWFLWALTLSRATFSICKERLMVFIFCFTGVRWAPPVNQNLEKSRWFPFMTCQENLERAWRSLIQGMEASSRFCGCPSPPLWDVWYTSARPEISSRSRADESTNCFSGTACSNLSNKGQTSVSRHDPNLGKTGSFTSLTPSSENWLLPGLTEGTSSPPPHSSASALWLPVEPTLEQVDHLEALRNKNCKQTFLFVRKIKQQNATLFYTGKTGHNRYSQQVRAFSR